MFLFKKAQLEQSIMSQLFNKQIDFFQSKKQEKKNTLNSFFVKKVLDFLFLLFGGEWLLMCKIVQNLFKNEI